MKQSSKDAPLNDLFTGSLESFADMLLTLCRALCRTEMVFGQPADTWVIIERSPTGARARRNRNNTLNVHIDSEILFPKAREWGPVVAGTARLPGPFKKGDLLTVATC